MYREAKTVVGKIRTRTTRDLDLSYFTRRILISWIRIQIAIKELTKNKTTIVIAHRLSTILNANNIYVIESGKVLENGNHDSLINV